MKYQFRVSEESEPELTAKLNSVQNVSEYVREAVRLKIEFDAVIVDVRRKVLEERAVQV